MTGVILSNFAPRDPPTVVTPESLFKSAVACQSRLIFCVPTFLEVSYHQSSAHPSSSQDEYQEWSQSQEKLAELQKFEAIVCFLKGISLTVN